MLFLYFYLALIYQPLKIHLILLHFKHAPTGLILKRIPQTKKTLGTKSDRFEQPQCCATGQPQSLDQPEQATGSTEQPSQLPGRELRVLENH